ncbi:MAG: hypothetical protein ABIG89_00840 [Candidatus Woesearchaeota archaeon]
MQSAVLDDLIVTCIGQDLVDLITDENVNLDHAIDDFECAKREKLERILAIIYNHDESLCDDHKISMPEDDDKAIILYGLEDCFHRYKDIKRKSGIPYINHPVSVARLITANSGDLLTVLGAFYHDTVEEHIFSMLKKKIKDALNGLYQDESIKKYQRDFSCLGKAQKNKIKKRLKQKAAETKAAVKSQFRGEEPDLMKDYLEKLADSFNRGLVDKGIDEDKAAEITGDLGEILILMTRGVQENYYKTTSNIIFPRDDVDPANKFRAVCIKLADCATNTEVVTIYDTEDMVSSLWTEEEKIYMHNPIKAILNAKAQNDSAALRRYNAINAQLNKKHKKSGSGTQPRGHKRVYRTFKNSLLINSFRNYLSYMRTSLILDKLRQVELLERAMVFSGLLNDFKVLTEYHNTHHRIGGQGASHFRCLGVLRQCAQNMVDKSGISNRNEISEFIDDVVTSGYFRHIDSMEQLEQVMDRYVDESYDFSVAYGQLIQYANIVIERSLDSATGTINRLVLYHGIPPALPLDKIYELVQKNADYIHAGGYNYLTEPAKRTLVRNGGADEIEELRQLLSEGTKRTLESPDGIFQLFIDAKVRGDDERLGQLYANKGNMMWAALASRTLGVHFKRNPRYVIGGLDRKGVHPARAITE